MLSISPIISPTSRENSFPDLLTPPFPFSPPHFLPTNFPFDHYSPRPQAVISTVSSGAASSTSRAYAAAPALGKLEDFVDQLSRETLAKNKAAHAADGSRTKEHDAFWSAQRAKFEAWDAEAKRAKVDPLVYTAVKEMEGTENFKVRRFSRHRACIDSIFPWPPIFYFRRSRHAS